MSIFVLKSEGIEPMLIGKLSNNSDDGIYEEVQEENIPKKYRINRLGGGAVINDKYLRSNTHGITSGKYFKKIAEPLNFNPIYKEKFEKLEDIAVIYDWNKIVEILEETDNNSIYELRFIYEENHLVTLNVIRRLGPDEIVAEEHPFKEYEDSFKEMYNFEIFIPLVYLTEKNVQEIKKGQNKRVIRVNLDDLKDIVNRYNLKVYKSDDYYIHECYSKRRTNFAGKDSIGINPYKNLNAVMTFTEASEKWKLSDSTLRKLVKTDKIKENIDYRKSGKVWLITTDAMERIYGKLD